MNNSKVKKIIIFFSFINIVLLCAYGGLFYTIKGTNKKTTEIYSSLYKKASEKDELRRVERSLTDTVEQRKILDSYFVRPAEAVSFIEQIEKLGDYARVDLKLNSVTQPKKAGDNFILDFNASGEFENMYRLFALIDEMPYRLSVRKAVISEGGAGNNESNKDVINRWSGSFTIVLESYIEK